MASEVQVHPALNPALNSPSYKIQLYSDQNSSNQTLEDSVRIKHSLPSEHQINQNNGIQFFGRIIAVGDKTKSTSRLRPQPDKDRVLECDISSRISFRVVVNCGAKYIKNILIQLGI